jgi:hypothetical protein
MMGIYRVVRDEICNFKDFFRFFGTLTVKND